MKIWHLTKTLAGGAGQYALRLSDALRAAGMESTVLVAEGPVTDGAMQLKRVDSPLRRLTARGIRSLSHRISNGPFHSLHGQELYESPDAIKDGDIVHLHGMTGWIGIAGLKQLVSPVVQIFQTTHGPWDISGGCVLLAGHTCQGFQTTCSKCPVLKNPWKAYARAELQTKKSFVKNFGIQPIANGEWMAARIRESAMYADVEVIPIITPIIEEAYLKSPISDLRAELDIPPDAQVICMGARSLTDPYKGILELLTKIAQKKTLADKITIMLFGEGEITVPDNLDIRILGEVSKPNQLARIYKTSDLYVSPSKMESFGITLIEAQAVGTPVLGFDVGGIGGAVCPTQHTNLVKLNDWEQLLEEIENSLSRPNTDKLRVRLRSWAAKSFSGVKVARKQIACYQNALSL